MVLGMHRSGTSLCSQVLSALGVDMVDPPERHGFPEHGNARGHWERWEIVGLHDRVLELLNRRYFDPTHDLGFPLAWWADPAVAAVREDIIAFLRARTSATHFGFKDPRTVRLLPLWHQIVGELKLAPKFVFCLRNPAQVARSLQARDGLAPEIGEARWFAYVLDFFRYNRGADFCLVEYEAWFDDAASNVAKLCEFLELDWRQTDMDLERMVSGIVDPGLRHDDPAKNQTQQPLVRSLYDLARRADTDHAAHEKIQTLVTHFMAYQQLHGGIQRGFEQIAAAAAGLPAVEETLTTLRAAIAERDASIERSRARAVVGEARAAVAEAIRDRAERQTGELDAKLAACRIEIAGLRDMLSRAEQQRQEREIELAASQAEIAGLRGALALTKQALPGRAIVGLNGSSMWQHATSKV